VQTMGSTVCKETQLQEKGHRDGSSCQASADLHCGLSRLQAPHGVSRRIRHSEAVPEVPKRPNRVETNLSTTEPARPKARRTLSRQFHLDEAIDYDEQ
jgi:hypothetical protein